jgi:hypothetical protein
MYQQTNPIYQNSKAIRDMVLLLMSAQLGGGAVAVAVAVAAARQCDGGGSGSLAAAW